MKHLLVLLFALCAGMVSAQDVIVKKDGSTILSKVLEVGESEIKYKKFDNLNGPTYTIKKSELQSINYQNGAKDTFSTPVREENRYLPNNQNDGVQRMNDRALLELDKKMNKNLSKKALTKKIIAWTGGAILVLSGIVGNNDNDDGKQEERNSEIIAARCICIGGGVLWTYLFLKSARKTENKAKMLQSSTIYQHDIPFSNGTILSLEANMLNDRILGTNTVGLGLCYKF